MPVNDFDRLLYIVTNNLLNATQRERLLDDTSLDCNKDPNPFLPWEFTDCPGEYRPSDHKYLCCGLPSDADPCEYLKNLHIAKEFRTYFLALVPLILSIIATLLNLIFAIIATLVLLKYGNSSKKRYSFLLSRSISTTLAQILFWIVLILWKTGGFEYSSAAIFLLVGSLSFLTLTGTYLALSTLLYFAVVHPFWYRTHYTMTKCVIIIVIIWVISIIFSICVGIYGATLFYPETTPVHCSFKTCQEPLAIVMTIVLALCYVTVLVAYALMFIWMRSWNKKSGGMQSSDGHSLPRQPSLQRNIRAMNRLSFSLISFAFSKLPLLVVCIVAVANLKHLASLGNGEKSFCKTYLNGKLYFQVELLASIAAIIWLLGMILDPVINTVGDPDIKRYIKNAVMRIVRRFTNKKRPERCRDPSDDSEELSHNSTTT